MRVRLKGLNRVSKRLADGSKVTYFYAWKGGPRLLADPRTPEFVAEFERAAATRKKGPEGTLLSALQAYQASTEFTDLAPRTRRDYVQQIKKIEARFGDFPLAAMADRRTRGIFKDWRDELAKRSRRQADYAYTVLARVLAWSLDRGHIDANPCLRSGRLYDGTRVDKVWTADEEDAFFAVAPEALRQAVMLALWTGQREGDLLRLPWSAYDGRTIRMRQSKTGARVLIPVGAPLRAMLDGMKKEGPIMLMSSKGRPWTGDGFRSSFSKARNAAGLSDRTFNDLRGTAVTRLAILGCSVPEIATLTGHSLADVQAILDAHYLSRDPAMAESAIRKLETGSPAVGKPSVTH